MIQSSAHHQQGMRNMLHNHRVEEAVVLPKGHYLQEASYIRKTNRGGREEFAPQIYITQWIHFSQIFSRFAQGDSKFTNLKQSCVE